MLSITLYIIATIILYLGFFICDWLGESHWAFYPTVFLTGSLTLIHLLGAYLKIGKNQNETKNKD